MKIKKVHSDERREPQYGYKLPIKTGVRVYQGYNSPYDHTAFRKGRDYNVFFDFRYCIDFDVPLGTHVYASRDGKVNGFLNGPNESYDGVDMEIGMSCVTNFIILKHPDGFLTLYSHLDGRSLYLMDDDFVRAGQLIAITGKSGWLGPKPHLHFCVLREKCPDYETYPVIFDDYDGEFEHSALFPHDF
jgi:murein DD-endopeptidase MepM/ murein hydrolase activator NlpD